MQNYLTGFQINFLFKDLSQEDWMKFHCWYMLKSTSALLFIKSATTNDQCEFPNPPVPA